MESVQHVKKIKYVYLLKKYIKWGVLRVAACPSKIKDARFLKVNVFQILPRHVSASGCHLQGVVDAL
jgi:hypothetical protein